jgi:hypothetical protein
MSQENVEAYRRFFPGWLILRLTVLAAAVLTISGCGDGDVDRDWLSRSMVDFSALMAKGHTGELGTCGARLCGR